MSGLNHLYFIINKINGCVEESNGNIYLLLVPNESKDTLKKYEELWSKTNNSDYYYHEKYIKIEFNLDDDLLIKKTQKLYNLVTVVRSIFHGGSKYYSQVFLDECLYKL